MIGCHPFDSLDAEDPCAVQHAAVGDALRTDTDRITTAFTVHPKINTSIIPRNARGYFDREIEVRVRVDIIGHARINM